MSYKITFLNQNSENNVEVEGLQHLESRKADLEFFELFNGCEDDDDFLEALKDHDHDSLEELEDHISKWKSTSKWHEYGLSFDFQEADQEEQREAYYRFQLSYGGPSEEIRFYEDGTIIFVYLHWFCGVGFDVSDEDGFEWVAAYFDETESMPWEDLPYEERHLLDPEEEE